MKNRLSHILNTDDLTVSCGTHVHTLPSTEFSFLSFTNVEQSLNLRNQLVSLPDFQIVVIVYKRLLNRDYKNRFIMDVSRLAK